ncbi:MAG TPA: hypothetical protein VF832_11410, partial [Longimicrobiales bacterium]
MVRRLFSRGAPRPPAVGLALALVVLALLGVWWLFVGRNAGTLHKHLPTGEVTGVPGRSAEKPLPEVKGPISALDRAVTEKLLRTRPSTRPLTGQLRIQADGIVWDDARGQPFVRAERVTGRLDLTQMLRGNAVVSGVDALRPRIWLYRTAGDTIWNYEHVLAAFLGPRAPGQPARKPGSEPLVEVRAVVVHGGFASVTQPPSPARPGVPAAPSYEVRFQDIQALLPRITLSAPHLAAPVVQVASGSAVFERPDLKWHLPFTARGATITVPDTATVFTVEQVAFGSSRLLGIHGFYDSKLPGLGVVARGTATSFDLADVRTFAPTLNLAGAGSFSWHIEPSADNGTRVALTDLRFASDNSALAGAVTFTALADTARAALESANLRLQPLRLAFLERVAGRKLPYAGDLSGRVTGEKGDIHFDLTAHLSAPGVSPFNVGLTGNAAFAPGGVALRGVVADLKGVPLASLRPVVPLLPLRGSVSGQLSLAGSPARTPLRLNVRLELPVGVALLNGSLNVTGATPAYDLTGRMLAVRLRDVIAVNIPPVAYTGGFSVRGSGFDPARASASFQADGYFSGWRAGPGDRVTLRGSVAGGVLRLDTLSATLASASVKAGGVWPYSAPGSGSIAYRLDVGDLAPFAQYLPAGPGGPAAGAVHLEGHAGGTLSAPDFNGRFTLAHVQAAGWAVGDAAGTYDVQPRGELPRIGLELQSRDVIAPSAGRFTTVNASLRLASPALSVTLDAQRPDGGVLALTAEGNVPPSGPRVISLQRLVADVGAKRWQLEQPALV